MAGAPRGPWEAKASADHVKQREIAAHRRAIDLHESAVRIFVRHGDEVRAEAARKRAQKTRDLLAEALVEQEQWDTTQESPAGGRVIGPGP
jgi:hypothetical protein